MAGASDPLHNGEKKITSVTTNTISYAVDPAAATSPTGTISVKMAPLGWNSPFTGTNLAVYTSANPQSLGMLLRVDDTGTLNSRVVGYESMTDVNTGNGPFPVASQQAGGLYWPKSSQANTNATQWYVIGDSKRFFYWCAPNNAGSAPQNGILTFFGDPILNSSVDAFGTYLLGCASDKTTTSSSVGECLGYTQWTPSAVGGYNARAYFQTGGAVQCWRLGGMGGNAMGYSGGSGTTWLNSGLTYPNPADNGIILTPLYFGGAGYLRGSIPGIYHCPQNVIAAFNHLDTMVGSDALVGRTLQAVRVGAPNSSSSAGYVFFDTTGPWQ
ncbi:hypothetical protein R76727_01248 [Ralstonia mannitolilytica]|nr:hypothetical protein R76727_01248 [Ralstonia mannitolilytica]